MKKNNLKVVKIDKNKSLFLSIFTTLRLFFFILCL